MDISEDRRFRLAMASSGIGMALVSPDGCWREVNPTLCRLLGRSAGELIGTPVLALAQAQDASMRHAGIAGLLGAADDMLETRQRFRHADGRMIDAIVNAALMRDARGQPEELIVQLREATPAGAASATLQTPATQSGMEELEAARRQLDAFVYGVSHDLRAPLRSIEGFAVNLIRRTDSGLDPQARDQLERIRSACTRMRALIDSLQELARVHRAVLRPGPVDVSLLAEWALAELQDAQPQRSADVQVEPGLEVIGDEALVRAMLSQLLANAWRFSSPRPQVRIRVQGRRGEGCLQVAVQDQGIGFDMAYAAKLFEPFQRLHGSEEGAGNGIGLTIARHVAMRHGGSIRAESTPGAGATFHVSLYDLLPAQADA